MEAIATVLNFVGAHPSLQVSIFILNILGLTFLLDYLFSKKKKEVSVSRASQDSALFTLGFLFLTTGIFLNCHEVFGLPMIGFYGNLSIAVAAIAIAYKNFEWPIALLSGLFLLVTIYLFINTPNYGLFVEEYIVPQLVLLFSGKVIQESAKKMGGQMAVLWGKKN